MSAIAGIVRRDGPLAGGELEGVLAPVRHRGPDHIGYYRDGSVGLAAALLTTTPEDRASVQPVVDDDLVLVFDGRVDNRAELCDTLKRDAQDLGELRVAPDAALVARAFRHFGDDFAARIIGVFALALWQRKRRRLTLARDIQGLRSLFYYHRGGLLVFGTEVAQVLAHPAVPREPNEAVVAEYLRARLSFRPETLYTGVKRVLPSQVVHFERGEERTSKYWDIDPERRIRYADDGQYADHVREVFEASLEARLRSTGPVGVQLSGGVDSSSVTGLAVDLQKRGRVQVSELVALSMVFPGLHCDESEFIDQVVEFCSVPSVRYDASLGPTTDLDEEAARYLDIPDEPNTALEIGLARLAAERGVRVVLQGVGADEFWEGSYNVVADLLRAGQIRQCRDKLAWDRRVYNYPSWPLLRFGVAPMLPRPVQRALDRAKDPFRVPTETLGPRLRHLGRQSDPPWHLARHATYAQRDTYREIHNGWTCRGYEAYDRVLSRFGLELRCPFVDRRMLELSFAFPEDQKRRREVTKVALRNAFRGVVPATVIDRTDKARFSPPREIVLRTHRDRILNSALAELGWVDADAVKVVYNRWSAQPQRGGDFQRLWMILALDSWYKSAVS